jgi:hypothetical protein
MWEVEADGEAPTKLRKNQEVFDARLRSRKGRIRDLGVVKGRTRFTIEITGLKTVPLVNVDGRVLKASDKRLTDTVVTLLTSALEGMADMKRRKFRELPRGSQTSRALRRRNPAAEITGPNARPGPRDRPDDGGSRRARG